MSIQFQVLIIFACDSCPLFQLFFNVESAKEQGWIIFTDSEGHLKPDSQTICPACYLKSQQFKHQVN